jgi:YHS domain-containing protein
MNIVKILVILVLLYVGYKIVMMFRRVKSQDVKGYRVNATPPKGEDLVQDPLCKTYVPKSQAYIKEIEGRQQYFCSQECCEKYLSEKR